MQNQVTYDVLEYYLKEAEKSADYILYEEPLALVSGVQTQLPVVLSEYQFYDRDDVDTYLALLETTGEYFDSLITFERAKSQAGLFMADYTAETVIEQCRAFLDMGDGKGDFRMMNRTMADSILELKEYNRYMKGIFSFVGFDTKWIPFHNVERTAGETKWSLPSLFRYAIDGILSFSSAPVTMAGTAGALLILAAIVTGIWALLSGNGLTGIPLLVCLILLLNGVQMFFISILGQYVSKDYMESKKRPIYIVKKKGGFTST